MKDEFADFYKAMFAHQVEKENGQGRVHGICLGHGLVRPVRRRIAQPVRTARDERYVLRHPWRGDHQSCKAASDYANTLVQRWDAEAITLARLTGWDVNAIRGKMAEGDFSANALTGVEIEAPAPKKSWWQRLWNNG